MARTTMAYLMLLGLTASGCAKSSAESAVTKAEGQIAAIRPEASKVAPTELKGLEDSITAMRAKVAAGDYSAALMGARGVSSLTRDLTANLPSRREQLTSSYNTIAAELPKRLEAVTAKIGELAAMRRLPPTIDAAKLSALQTAAGGWAAEWSAVTQDFAAGNLAVALGKANQLKAKLLDAGKSLGLA